MHHHFMNFQCQIVNMKGRSCIAIDDLLIKIYNDCDYFIHIQYDNRK